MAVQVGRALPLLLLQMLMYPTSLLTENIALYKTASQSGTHGDHRAIFAVDGNLAQGVSSHCAISNPLDPMRPSTGITPFTWWKVDLAIIEQPMFFIQRVIIYSKLDQSRAFFRGSIIKAGRLVDIASQEKCADITQGENVINKQCNPIPPVRYVSIVSNFASSLHICEVQIEGYPLKLFQTTVEAPRVLEIGPASVMLQIVPSQREAELYQILYSAQSGDNSEQYGTKTQVYRVVLQNLAFGTMYDIRILYLQITQENNTAISLPITVSIPQESDFARLTHVPMQLSVGQTMVSVSFNGDAKARQYKVHARAGATMALSKIVDPVPGQYVYTTTLENLQPATRYSITVTPYTVTGTVTLIRGYASPPLTTTTLASGSQSTSGPIEPKIPSVGTTTSSLKPTASSASPTARVNTERVTRAPVAASPTLPTKVKSPSSCNGIDCRVTAKQVSEDWIIFAGAGAAGGLLLLLLIILIIVCVVKRRRKQTDGMGAQPYTQPDDMEGAQPAYENSLPTNSAGDNGSMTESGVAPAPSLPSRDKRSSTQRSTATSTAEEDKLHEEADSLYSRISKVPDEYEG